MKRASYFYRDEAGREIGPLPLAALEKLLSGGVLNGDTAVRAEDSDQWMQCRDIVPDEPGVTPANSPPAAPEQAADTRRAWPYGWVFYALAMLFFSLPFGTFSSRQTNAISVTGLQMVTGDKFTVRSQETLSPFSLTGATSAPRTLELKPRVSALALFGCCLLATVLALFRTRASYLLASLFGAGGIFALFQLRKAFTGDMAFQQGYWLVALSLMAGTYFASRAFASTPSVERAPKGWGGWLAFFTIIHVLVLPVALAVLAVAVFSGLALTQGLPVNFVAYILSDLTGNALLTGYGIYVGVRLWRLRPGAVRLARRYLIGKLTLIALGLLLPRFVGLSYSEIALWTARLVQADVQTAGDGSSFLYDMLGVGAFYAAWFFYFERSGRISATFTDRVDAAQGLNFAKTERITAAAFPTFGIIVYCAVLWHFSLLEKTGLTFAFTLDGKTLPAGQHPEARVDGVPFTSGSSTDKIAPGRHRMVVSLKDAETFERTFWTFYGVKNLGDFPLETSKGSLSVTVKPSPATVVVSRDGVKVQEGAAPLGLEKLPVGRYDLLIRRGEYSEHRLVTVERAAQTKAEVELELGSVDLSAEPADAEFELTGAGKRWSGKLPAHLDDVPVGSYALLTRRKGWELAGEVQVTRLKTTDQKTEFPYGTIAVTSDPSGLAVSLDGVSAGKTPVALHEIRPETHKLSVSDGENDLSADVALAPKEQAKQSFVFRYGAVQVTSIPSGATVLRNGKDVGKTPVTLPHLPVGGGGTVVFRLNGYVPSGEVAVKVAEGVTTILNGKLFSEQYASLMRQTRDALQGGLLSDAKKSIAAALLLEPSDQAATALQEDVNAAVFRAEQAAKAAAHAELVAVIEKAIAAFGGRDALSVLASCRRTVMVEGRLEDGDTTYAGQMTVFTQAPDRLKIVQNINIHRANFTKSLGFLGALVGTLTVGTGSDTAINMTLGINGNAAWQTLDGTTQQMPAPTEIEMRSTIYMNQCMQLLTLLGDDFQLEKASSNGRTTAITVRKAGQPDCTLYFESQRGFLVGASYWEKDKSGKDVSVTLEFSDFQNFNGVIFSRTIKLVKSAKYSETHTITEIVPLSSAGTPAAIFRVPAGIRQ